MGCKGGATKAARNTFLFPEQGLVLKENLKLTNRLIAFGLLCVCSLPSRGGSGLAAECFRRD